MSPDDQQPQSPASVEGAFDFQAMDARRFRALVENAAVGMFHIDLEAGWIYRNQALSSLLNLPSFETLVESSYHFNLIHVDDRDRFVAEYQRVQAQKVPLEIDLRYLMPDGNIIWVVERFVPDLDEVGNIRS